MDLYVFQKAWFMAAGDRALAPRHRREQHNGYQWVWFQKLGRTKSLSQGSGDFMKDVPFSSAGGVPSR